MEKVINNTAEAFRWIIQILKKHKVPFQISGGLAAKAYGSSRPLADIDIAIPENRFNDILPDVKTHIISGPVRFEDENFNCLLMTLNYASQEIDIGGGNAQIRDAATGVWHNDPTDFSRYESREIYGLSVPVIKKEDLIKSKKILGRPVDIDDVKEIS